MVSEVPASGWLCWLNLALSRSNLRLDTLFAFEKADLVACGHLIDPAPGNGKNFRYCVVGVADRQPSQAVPGHSLTVSVKNPAESHIR